MLCIDDIVSIRYVSCAFLWCEPSFYLWLAPVLCPRVISFCVGYHVHWCVQDVCFAQFGRNKSLIYCLSE